MAFSRRFVVAAALALSTLVGACAGGGEGAAGAKVVRIVSGGATVDGKFDPGGLTGVVAQQGWLRDELKAKGYELRFIEMPHAIGGPMINEGFVNRTVEFAYYGDLPAVIGASAGAPIRLVAPFNTPTNTYLVVSPNSPYKTVADLKGKRVALHRGRPWEAVFARLTDSQGLGIDDFKVYNVNPSAGAAALAAGKVDAFVGPIADANRLVEEGVGRILWTTKGAPKSWGQRVELFGRGDFIDANPEAAQLVATAFVRAGQWASRDENRDAYIARLSRETPERAIRAELEGTGPWRDRFSPLATEGADEHYRKVIDYAAATGLISQKPEVGPLVDLSLIRPAVRLANAEGWWASQTAAADASSALR